MLLERRYRRLLLAYPRDYRRARGGELLSTLLDLAPEERTRPTLREAVNLIRHGLRCRLGRPGSRSVLTWSVLTAVICGLFLGALGSRIGWQAARPEPGPAEVRALVGDAVPDLRAYPDGPTYPGHFALQDAGPPRPIRLGDLRALAGGFGPLHQSDLFYRRSVLNISATVSGAVDVGEVLATVRQRLAADGWRLTGVTVVHATVCSDVCVPHDVSWCTARRGDVVLQLGTDAPLEPGVAIDVTVFRATPVAVPIAAVLLGLAGAVSAWLVFGWASRRTPGAETVKGLLATALVMWWSPALLAAPGWFVRRATAAVVMPPVPLWEWLGQPDSFGLFLIGCGAAGLALAIAAVRPRLIRWTAHSTIRAW